MRNPIILTDFYKTIHHMAYTEGLDYLVSYWTPRMSRIEGIDKVVMFGLQATIKKYLINEFNENFFKRPKEEVMKEYKRIIVNTMTEQAADTKHLEELYDLGYLPIQIKAVPEGTRVNIKTPMFEISNTVKGFGWLVNYLETLISSNVWLPITSATTAYRYRQIVNEYFDKTVSNKSMLQVVPKEDGDYIHHLLTPVKLNDVRSSAVGDFSMRGMGSVDSAMVSAAAHLLSFTSTATIPAIPWLEEYYNADCEKEIVGSGTPSTEHSVMSSYGREGEFDCYKRLITKVFPKGNLSIVSDTYDYWNVLTNYIPKLKDDILSREGKIIIRGDSGNPVDIICGRRAIEYKTEKEFKAELESRSGIFEEIVKVAGEYYRKDKEGKFQRVDKPVEVKGTVEILWEIFGGYINDKGYKVLDSHIGAIYGDSITPERAQLIYERLEKKGFAATNCVLGAGSYSYQYATRDTYGQALKATHSVINGLERQIYKDPKTDNGRFKKSQRGMCYVYQEGKDILYKDGLTIEEVKQKEGNILVEIFKDGEITKEYELKEIRERIHGENLF